MDKETIFIDLTEGKRKLDTSQMDKWTEKEWDEWVGDDTKYVGIQAVLLNESDIYLKMTSTYTNEETNEKHVSFEAKSKRKRNYSIQFNKLKDGELEFDISHSNPESLGEDSGMVYFEKTAKNMDLTGRLTIDITVFDDLNKTNGRKLEFIIKIFPE